MDTRIKLCGLKRQEDITYANQLLPDYIGFVFARGKRFVTDEQARELKAGLDERIKTVGVFVNEPPSHVSSLLREGVIAVAQLHGDEDEAYIETLRKTCHQPIIKVIKPVQGTMNLRTGLQTSADYLLFDSGCGSGRAFDWSLLKGLQERKNESAKPFFLAGGLTPENVAEAIERVQPYAVDVSSGVESDGVKDFEKMRRLVEAVRSKNK